MTVWTKLTVGDLCNTISETYHRNDKKVILINTSDVLDGKILNHKSVENNKLRGQFKKTFKKNDILFSEIRPENRRFAYIDFEETECYIASTKLMVLRPKTDMVLPRFLFAFLSSASVLKKLQHLAETRSGTFPQITFSSEIAPMPVTVPDFETQKKIVGILSLIEGKIQNNNKINKNLEQQAQAIYTDMFGVPGNDWRLGILSDIADVTMGQSPSGKSYNETHIGTVFYQGRAEFGFRFPTQRLFTTEPKHMAKENDVLISVRAPVGDLNVAREDCCIGRGLGAIHSKDNHQSFVFYTVFALKNQLNVFNGEGTVFGSINKNSLKSMPVVLPPDSLIEKFEEIVAPMDATIRINHEENLKLSVIQDNLLPCLMSGELDVSDIDL